jgi:hypothetical protein
VGGSVGYRRGKVHLLLQALPHLLEPCSWIVAVDDSPQKSQPFSDIVAIAPNIILGDPVFVRWALVVTREQALDRCKS